MKKNYKLDKEREFRFDHITGMAFEDAYGNSLINSLKRMGPRVVNHMVRATLKHNFQDKLTGEQTAVLVQKFIDRGGDIQKLVRFLIEGWTSCGVIGKESEEAKSIEDLETEAKENPGDPSSPASSPAPGS